MSQNSSLFLFRNMIYTVSKVSLICKGSDQDLEHTIISFVLNIRTCTCDRASLHKQSHPLISFNSKIHLGICMVTFLFLPFLEISLYRSYMVFHKINMCTNVTHDKSKFNVVRHRQLSTASERKDILCFCGFFIPG